MPPSSPAAALFDNDGLVLDTELLWTRAEQALFARHGLAFTDDHKRVLLGSAGEEQARHLERLLDQPRRGHALRDELYALVMEEARHGVEPMPGALDLLARVRGAGLALGLASNSQRGFLDAVVAAAGLSDTFDAVLSADDVALPKPAPDIYLSLARRLGVDPADCVALEDSPTGVAAARAAGVFTIGVPSFPGVVLPDADLVCPRLADPRVAAALGISAA